ncbi:MAG: alpha/beta hydrolase [Proteobacteria bacterium]|nr:alpha/beta hydrolase [Pseudomonadota bacterium]
MFIPDVLGLGLTAYAACSTLVGSRFTRPRRQRLPAASDGQADARAVGFPSRDGLTRIEGSYLGARPGAPAIVIVHGKDACRGNALGAPSAALADSAFADLGEVLQRNYRRLTHLPAALFPASALVAQWLTGVNLRRFRPLDLAATLAARPVLLIHSEGDRVVPCEHAHRLARAFGASLWTTPSTGHLSSYRSDPDGYVRRVRDFFTGALAPADAFSAAAA